jgi:hypothetical protein
MSNLEGESFAETQARLLVEQYKEYLFIDSSGKSYTLMRKRKVVSNMGGCTLEIGQTIEIFEVCGEKSWIVKVAKLDKFYDFITLDCDVDIRSHEPDLYIPTPQQSFYQGRISGGRPFFERGRIITTDLMKMINIGSTINESAGAEGCGLFYDMGSDLLGICVGVSTDSSGEHTNRFIPIGFCI